MFIYKLLLTGNHRIHIHKYEDTAKKAAEEEMETSKRKQHEVSI